VAKVHLWGLGSKRIRKISAKIAAWRNEGDVFCAITAEWVADLRSGKEANDGKQSGLFSKNVQRGKQLKEKGSLGMNEEQGQETRRAHVAQPKRRRRHDCKRRTGESGLSASDGFEKKHTLARENDDFFNITPPKQYLETTGTRRRKYILGPTSLEREGSSTKKVGRGGIQTRGRRARPWRNTSICCKPQLFTKRRGGEGPERERRREKVGSPARFIGKGQEMGTGYPDGGIEIRKSIVKRRPI